MSGLEADGVHQTHVSVGPQAGAPHPESARNGRSKHLSSDPPGCYDHIVGWSYPDLSEPRVRLVPPLLTENRGSPLASEGLSPSLL